MSPQLAHTQEVHLLGGMLGGGGVVPLSPQMWLTQGCRLSGPLLLYTHTADMLSESSPLVTAAVHYNQGEFLSSSPAITIHQSSHHDLNTTLHCHKPL